MVSDELVWRSGLDLAAMIRKKEISPVEITEALLTRIDALNPRLNAFCLVTPDVARVAAREAEIAVMKREPIGPLHGVPVSIKDVLYTRGIRTTGGSRLFAELMPEEDAIAVSRLRASRAVILGKTNTSEFGHKAVTDNPLFGPTRNPWNLDLTPRLLRRRRRRGGERPRSARARQRRRGIRPHSGRVLWSLRS